MSGIFGGLRINVVDAGVVIDDEEVRDGNAVLRNHVIYCTERDRDLLKEQVQNGDPKPVHQQPPGLTTR